MAELLDYKCPRCGGKLEFDAKAQMMKCPYCDSVFTVDEVNNGTGEEEAEKRPLEGTPLEDAGWQQDSEGWRDGETDSMKVYVCKSCGGEIIADETTGATSCPFCGNPVIISGQFSGQLRPDLVIPFKIDKKAAKEALKKHIASKKFVPKVFTDENHIDEIKGIYVPYWLFDCDANANASYSGEQVRTWHDRKYDYVETSYFRMERSGQLKIAALPVDGSEKIENALTESVEPYDLSEAVDFETAYLSGYLADKYDVSVEESVPRANERIRESIDGALRATVNGYLAVRQISADMAVKNEKSRYALYPMWILNTSWKGNKYVFAVNGQTGKIVGDLPLDKGAFWKRTGILAAVFAAVLYAVNWILLFF